MVGGAWEFVFRLAREIPEKKRSQTFPLADV